MGAFKLVAHHHTYIETRTLSSWLMTIAAQAYAAVSAKAHVSDHVYVHNASSMLLLQKL